MTDTDDHAFSMTDTEDIACFMTYTIDHTCYMTETDVDHAFYKFLMLRISPDICPWR